MSVKEKFSGYFSGLKSLLSRNPILIIIMYCFEKYGTNMVRGFRTLVGAQTLGLTGAVLGFVASAYTIVGLVVRTPIGIVTDKYRDKIKQIIIVAYLLRAVSWAGFMFVNSTAGYYLVYLLDGFFWSCTTTMLPALLAVCVDRKVLGTAAALYMGIPNIVTGTSRSVGISLFKTYGIQAAAGVAAATAVCAAICTFLLDTKAMVNAGNEGSKPSPQKKKNGGFALKLVPFCIVAAMPIVIYNAYQNFFQVHAEAEGITYLAADALGATIFGILNIAMGPICDLINPKLFLIVSLACQAIASFIWGSTTATALITFSLMIYYCTRWYGTVFKVQGQKMISKSDYGKLSGMMFLFNDLFTAVCTSVVGVAADKMGYAGCFKALGAFGLITLVAYIVVESTIMKKLKVEKDAEEIA